MAILAEDMERYKDIMLGLVPPDGTPRGNVSLFEEFRRLLPDVDVADEDLWEVRNALVDDGKVSKGRGRGGSVYRRVQPVIASAPAPQRSLGEKSLYEPFHAVLKQSWTKDNQIQLYVSEVTAAQGARVTGGKWTRPDVTLVAVRSYQYNPSKSLEVVTFELKPKGSYDISGVFETAAHSVFAHKSYLVMEVLRSSAFKATEEAKRLEQLCRKFGVGLMVFGDVDSWGTYEVLVEPLSQTPDPIDVDAFIETQLSAPSKSALAKLLH